MKKIFILLLFTAFGTIVSCKKLVSIDSPPDQLTPDKVFNTASSVTAATADMYTLLGTVDQNFIPPVGTYSDELVTTRIDATSSEFSKSLLTPVNSSVLSIWQNLYTTIYKANAIIIGLQVPVTIPDSIKNQCLGEALFMRAYSHFLLTNIFGDVPLVTTTNVTINASAKRASSTVVYGQVITDLKQAALLLPTAYTGDGEKVRANKWAATALLAKVHLYTGDFIDAENQASLVINSNQYTLTDLNSIFLANSDEAILQLWNINGYTTLNSVPFSGIATYQIATSLLNSFESGDNRLSAWVKSTTLSGVTYYYPYKYKLNSPSSGGSSEYTMYLRLGEIYLIRAESRAQQNNLAGAAADLNVIRNRAGLSSTLASTQSAMLSAIYHERQVELFDEAGNRFFDLKRTGTINTVLGQIKPLWKPTGSLFPIPQSDELKDPFLTQNLGYTN
jgi:hypothetical protein